MRHSHFLCGLLACALGASACTGSTEDDQAGSNIQLGTEDAQHLNVVLLQVLRIGGGSRFCSGTMIGARTLLTSAHCVADITWGAAYLTSPGVSSVGALFEDWVIPDEYIPGDDFHLAQADLAVVSLQGDLNLGPDSLLWVAPILGERLTFLGYGMTQPKDPHRGISSFFIGNLRRDMILLYGIIGGEGDSGGPGLVDGGDGSEVIAGVLSGGGPDPEDDNHPPISYFTRVDLYLDWIATYSRGGFVGLNTARFASQPSD